MRHFIQTPLVLAASSLLFAAVGQAYYDEMGMYARDAYPEASYESELYARDASPDAYAAAYADAYADAYAEAYPEPAPQYSG
jgi:hypothetical protein